ncbi:MAG TPA: DUF1707 domain-containing protein [Streptosporangiaceae bacterium]|nr:DUF1707 domain-containing protein [Streptosporangiaceae bacterium]
MSSPAGSPQQAAPALRRASWPGSQMRVSDAERTAIADRLAKHFSDGRLDESEFSERLDRAMRATTMADLTGLLSDLPDSEPALPQPPAGGRRHQRKMLKIQVERERLRLKHERRQQRKATHRQRTRSLGWLVLLAAGVVLAIIVANALRHSIGAWLVLGLIAFIWLRRGHSGYRGS